MKESPILFSTPMVQAILENRKTVTRRIVKATSPKCIGFQIERNFKGEITNVVGYDENESTFSEDGSEYPTNKKWLYADQLWVRETWTSLNTDNGIEYAYKASATSFTKDAMEYYKLKWKPSIHMPKSACRIRLNVVSVLIEKLQEITEEQCVSEGVLVSRQTQWGDIYYNYLNDRYEFLTAKESFKSLWIMINGAESWHDNPYVWVINFEKL